MAPTKRQPRPPTGLHHGDVLFPGDEAEGVGRERDAARQPAEVFIRLSPDGGTERSDGLFT